MSGMFPSVEIICETVTPLYVGTIELIGGKLYRVLFTEFKIPCSPCVRFTYEKSEAYEWFIDLHHTFESKLG